ncbi:MAG: hypothetical protein AB7E32_01030 [Desulfovibrio sp.]
MYKRYLPYGIGAALLLTMALLTQTCSGRATENLEQSLLGHWRTADGMEIYYSEGRAVGVSVEGTRSYHPWRILLVNEKDSWMKILIGNSDGVDVSRVLQFNEDRTVYRASRAPGFSSGSGLSEAEYLDDRQTP